MQIERHETGSRMSKAVIHGDTVYLAGIVADSPKGKGMAEQAKSFLSQIDRLLAGATPTRSLTPHGAPPKEVDPAEFRQFFYAIT